VEQEIASVEQVIATGVRKRRAKLAAGPRSAAGHLTPAIRHRRARPSAVRFGFDLEEAFVTGDRAVIRWRLRGGEGESNSVRGVNVMRVRDGLIVESPGL
jgi:hypothetical protein